MKDKIGWYVHPKVKKWAKPFEDKYQMIEVIMVGDNSFPKNKIWKQEGRHCIFCDKSYPDVSFKKVAHLLPRMIGNTDLFSTFECDTCNQKFSLLESDLASFLGLSRSIVGLKDVANAPGFPGIGLEAKSILFKNKKILVIHKENAERNKEEESTKLDYLKPSYTPANIYKLFLKCALSLLPNEEVAANFQSALKHLQGGTVLGGAHINIFRFPVEISMPLHAYIFRKKQDKEQIPLYIVAFYFHNLVISAPVLLHKNDLQYLNKPVTIPAPPPYFIYGNPIDKTVPTFSTHDLSSPLKLKSEPESFILKLDKIDPEKAVCLDLKTGEESYGTYEPVGSKYFIATEQGVSFTKEELKELIEIIDDKFLIK